MVGPADGTKLGVLKGGLSETTTTTTTTTTTIEAKEMDGVLEEYASGLRTGTLSRAFRPF
jgi:hypothetical protein